MSIPNQSSQRTLQENVTLDATEDLERVENTFEATRLRSFDEDAGTSAAMNASNFELSPTLPTGEVIDGKNTLQTFEGSRRDPLASIPLAVEAERPALHPTLPDGQVITGKNTLQSFETAEIITLPRTPLDHPDSVTDNDETKRLSNEEAPPPNAIGASPLPSTTVVAFAVETDIVYAEVSPEPVMPSVAPDRHENENASVNPPWYQARSTYVLLTVIALLLAVVLGVSIGLSNDSSNTAAVPTSAPISAVPTSAPITAVPTSAPIVIDPNIMIREAVLTSYINNITLSNQTITANGTSPESQALAWMIYNDTTLDTSAVISENDPIASNAIGFRIRQRYPLLVMWFQQDETVKWAVTTGWLEDQSECAWEGITCNPLGVDYSDEDFNAGLENAVTQVTFNLVGSYVGVIPSDVGLLSNLKHFEVKNTRDLNNLNGRYLQGTLPSSIGQWTALTYFDASSNGLIGTLPDGIGQWMALTYFDVGGNALTGPLPDSIGQWAALTSFAAGGTSLNGTLPDSIGQWTALTSFYACCNFLTGTLPDSIGQWTALTSFGASGTSLNGTLPDSIGQWTALMYFDASANRLTGTLPDAIGNWTALTHIDLYGNGLSGPLPDSIGHWTDLTGFDINSNGLTGTIPSSIGNWSLIEWADFSENSFMGTLPNSICHYIDGPDTNFLRVNCGVNCTCCTEDCA